MKTWRLKKGADRRFRMGHPWVFSGEIAHSTRDVDPGEIVELRDAADHFLAYGCAHPSSNISFRRMSSRAKDDDVGTVDFFLRRFKAAKELRVRSGFARYSHRWLFGEVDGVPGLVADLFRGEEDLLVFQIATAGMERLRPEIIAAFEQLGFHSWIETSTSSQRKVEGLNIRREAFGVTEGERVLHLRHLNDRLDIRADFTGGQKTGFFLDQQANSNLLLDIAKFRGGNPIRVLDLCCYVGQWSVQLARLAKDQETQIEVDLVDSSAEALALAKKNVDAYGGAVATHELDVMEDWPGLNEEAYDIVICDPPAFVKKKTDADKATGAYVRLNREALRRVKPGGLLATSSCSGGIREADFTDILGSAQSKAGRTFKLLAHGGHAPDHPISVAFPEGRYLKCWIGQVDYPF